ncbi:Dynamin domain-containing protein [Desulfonema limicola]|uniref:Dynamin domain-containing protein n=1 Tax=Desulfonema limicola TaxID=45656 RepID=A0A975BEC7_9BACT|nr:hypothetical protein [Desulfonema limicola]QTA83560.1 Dynamin domain-containing protein [Desulfonema limicola]
MLPQTYETLRNELIGLLENAAAIDAVKAQTRDLLSSICRKALENQFEIVIAGEFQGGKSTTFNSLCNGRELSPVGSGIKTSGCIVTAENISDPGEPETAQIKWRTSEELVSGFSDILLPHLKLLEPGRFKNLSALELSSQIDLKKDGDRKLAARAAELEWDIWKKNKSGYDPLQKGLLDILRCAALIARYYADDFLENMRQKKNFALEEIRKMIVFPQDWEDRWAFYNPDRFKLEEILFIFISRIRIRIHSENLGRLGSVLADCPGLFAGRWDTETAKEAMFQADAILYLFDGSKTLKMSDLRVLEFIRKNGMEYKLFFGCNMRTHTLADSIRILDASISSLKNSGFKIKKGDAVLFHALLAFLASKGEKLLKENPEPVLLSEPQFMKICKSIQRQAAVLDINDISQDCTLDIIKSARNASRIDSLIQMVEKSVISRKARSILIENGARLAANCLLEAEGALQLREDNASKKEYDFRVQAAEVETSLRKFRGNCAGIIHRLDTLTADEAIADDIWNRLESALPQLCDKTADRIYNEVIKKLSLSLLAKKKFQDKISSIIKSEIDECFSETINTWAAEIKDGYNTVYNKEIVRPVRQISRELKTIWNASVLSEMNLLTGIELPEFSGYLEMDSVSILRELESGHALENIRYNALLAAGGVTGIFTAASGVLIAVYMLITRLFWIRITAVVVFLVNIILMFLTKGMIEKSLKQEIRQKLFSALNTLFFEIKDDVRNEFRNFSKGIRRFYIQVFESAVNRPGQIFEERKLQAETDFRKSRKQRLDIAQNAKKTREEQIMPLRIALQDYTKKVENELAETRLKTCL